MAEKPKKQPTNSSEVHPTTKKKPRRSAEGLLAKKESDRRRRQTRICIGVAFPRWRALKKEIGLRADTDFALLLLDNFQKQQMSSASSSRPTESLPARATEESGDEETQLGCRDIGDVGGELSMYSFSNTEEEEEDSIDEDEVVDIDGCWKNPTHKSLTDEGVKVQLLEDDMDCARGTKSMPGVCSVDGCDSGSRSAQQFKLPEDPERRLEWVMFLAKVNKQCFKESSWTDITVCSEHFTDDCLDNVNGNVQLKASAVPSLCLNSQDSGSEDLVESCKHEPEDNSEVVGQHDQLKTHEGPNSCSEESRPASSGVPSGASCSAGSSLRSQIQPKRVNADIVKEKATLLKKGKFPVNEKRLLQLFRRNCPTCGSKVLMYKVTRGVLINIHQLCRKCDYTYQWKSQVDGNVPAAENGLLAGDSEAAPADEASSSGAGGLELDLGDDEESDSMYESSDPGDMDSDEDWNPTGSALPKKSFRDANEADEECSNDYYPALTSQFSQLCTDCGKFYDKRRPHICEHKLKPFSCNICGSRCINKQALSIHSRIHNENYQFCCKFCHVAFKLKADKVTHEKIHMTQGTPYKCPECSETFATNQERRMHLDDHRGPDACYCHICNVKFRSQKDFERHELVHTGEKPFKCPVCQRGFTQSGNLKSHMRLHTGERPYKCQHCGKCFNHNVSLKSHLQRYHAGSSGAEQTKEVMSRSKADGAQRNESKGGAVSESNECIKMEVVHRPKSNRRSTGRPIGRPKRFGSEKVVGDDEVESQGSNSGTSESQVQRQKRKRFTEEEDEGEPSDGDKSTDDEDEEDGEKLGDSSEHSGVDSDFDPAETRRKMKKKRCNSKNKGRIKGKGRGRPRKHLVA